MKRAAAVLLIALSLSTSVRAQSAEVPSSGQPGPSSLAAFLEGIRDAIHRNLGRPYVWGASGQKSFDCSGFVWKVMNENGILMKRTTARKFFMILKPATKEEQGNFGTLVFFDDLKHIGIIDTPQAFYHAQVSKGTNRSEMNPFWRQKIYGYRRLPVPNP